MQLANSISHTTAHIQTQKLHEHKTRFFRKTPTHGSKYTIDNGPRTVRRVAHSQPSHSHSHPQVDKLIQMNKSPRTANAISGLQTSPQDYKTSPPDYKYRHRRGHLSQLPILVARTSKRGFTSTRQKKKRKKKRDSIPLVTSLAGTCETRDLQNINQLPSA